VKIGTVDMKVESFRRHGRDQSCSQI